MGTESFRSAWRLDKTPRSIKNERELGHGVWLGVGARVVEAGSRCVCVCVCVRERERGGGERETETDRQTDRQMGQKVVC